MGEYVQIGDLIFLEEEAKCVGASGVVRDDVSTCDTVFIFTRAPCLA